jgi:hypothetical protein
MIIPIKILFSRCKSTLLIHLKERTKKIMTAFHCHWFYFFFAEPTKFLTANAGAIEKLYSRKALKQL